MRVFIAIELPESVRSRIAALVGRLRESGARVSWVRPENMHLTLRFLGEADPEPVERLEHILSDAYKATPAFALQVQGTGAFPNTRKPSVIWVGVGPLEGPLMQVQDAAEAAARAIGLPPEKKAFHAHITLARIRNARAARPLMERFEEERDFDAGEFSVASVSLFSSQLTPKGPIYARLEEYVF